MPLAQANGIELCYETFGDAGNPSLLLIMGLGGQMIMWDEQLCRSLADSGLHVIRFDNREMGLSTKSPAPAPVFEPVPAPPWLRPAQAPEYNLSTMAADAAGLLDALNIPAAHVVGMSMGGMIAQQMAAEFSDRVLSLTSIMSTTGDPTVGQATPAALGVLLRPAPPEREAYLEHAQSLWQVLAGPTFDSDYARTRAEATFERGLNPIGAAFQLAAIMASGNRTEAVSSITCPTLVIHGQQDPLIALSGGEATAAAIPGARLEVVDPMGHDIPPSLWPSLTTLVTEHIRAC